MRVFRDLLPNKWQLLFRSAYRGVHRQVTSPYTKLIFLAALFYVCTQEEISFNISIEGAQLVRINEQSVLAHSATGPRISVAATKELDHSSVAVSKEVNLAAAAPKKKSWTKKQRAQLAYVDQFLEVARDEFQKHGIPTSITLAQGLLESGHGTSTLARRNKNHFGIKCFSKKCRKGHCSNHSDDHHKDFFRNFTDERESYAAHSQVLMKDRYKSLFRLSHRDYKGWSHGLRKAGYATDPRYGDKLIHMIETLELWRYDRVPA